MRKIFTLALVSILMTTIQAQKIDLSLHLEQGKEYNQILVSTATINQEFNGQEMNILMTIKGEMEYKVIAANRKDYELEVTYKSLSMNMDMPQGSMSFSSENSNEQDVFSKILSKLTNKPFEVTMSKNGSITEVRKIDEIFNSILDDFTDIPAGQITQLKAQLTEAYGGEALKGNLEMATAIFPKKPVEVGDKWEIKTDLKSTIAMNMTTEYELTEIGNDDATIKGSSLLEAADKDEFTEANGMQMKYNLSGTMTSEIKVDKATGWILQADIHQEIKGEAFIKESPAMPDGLKVPMTITNEMTLTDK